MRLVQILTEWGCLQKSIRLLSVELPGLFDNTIFQDFDAVQVILLEFLVTEAQVDIDGLLEQVHIYQLLIPLSVDCFENGLCDVSDEWLEDNRLEDFKTLERKWGQRVDLNVKPIQVLEEPLHPSDHDAMIVPFGLKFLEHHHLPGIRLLLNCNLL